MLCISDQGGESRWHAFHLENISTHSLGVAAFFIRNDPYDNFIPIDYTEHHQSCNFKVFGYPNEYLTETGNMERPDLAFHQGYIIRRLTNLPSLEYYGSKLFEINLTLSKGCHGAPIMVSNPKLKKLSVIGIYVGTYKFLISKEYNALINGIYKFTFDELVKKLRERDGAIKITFGVILDLLPTELNIPAKLFSDFAKGKAESESLKQEIKSRESLKETLQKIHGLISEEIYIKYGLAIRISDLQGWITEYTKGCL